MPGLFGLRGSSRKPSASSGENDGTSGTVTPETSSEGQPLSKSQSRLRRAFTGLSKSEKSKKSSDRDEPKHLNRPFSQQNLEHQKILNAFEWNFGRRKSSSGGRSSISGISPSASRNTSVDANYHGGFPGDRRGTQPRFSTSLMRDPPQEEPGEELGR